jgi:hypothetical protein
MPRRDFILVFLGAERASGGLLAYRYSLAPGWVVSWLVTPGPDMPDHDDPGLLASINRLREGLPP